MSDVTISRRSFVAGASLALLQPGRVLGANDRVSDPAKRQIRAD